MSTRKRRLTPEEIRRAFEGGEVPPIISPAQLSAIVGISLKTIYQWVARGRFDGALRKRGKHILFWRDRAIALLFNGPAWEKHDSRQSDSNR